MITTCSMGLCGCMRDEHLPGWSQSSISKPCEPMGDGCGFPRPPDSEYRQVWHARHALSKDSGRVAPYLERSAQIETSLFPAALPGKKDVIGNRVPGVMNTDK